MFSVAVGRQTRIERYWQLENPRWEIVGRFSGVL